MDNVAHTLLGVTIAQSGLGSRTALGCVAVVIGANLPDIDAATYLYDSDTALWFRRGWTHGLLALVVLPPTLTLALLLLARVLPRDRGVEGRQLLLLSTIGIWSHPLLDWLNNYGLRWLMPFDDRWFYGDAVFIVDPWIWLALGSSVFLFRSRTVIGRLVWAVGIGLSCTPVLFMNAFVSAKVIWFAGLALLLLLRWKRVGHGDQGALLTARVALGITALYVGTMLGSSHWARAKTTELLEARGIPVKDLMVAPRAVTPFTRNVVVAGSDEYRFGVLSLVPTTRLELSEHTIPRLTESDVLTRTWNLEEVRGFTSWARFPFAEIVEDETGYAVYLADARYAARRSIGLGSTTARVSKD